MKGRVVNILRCVARWSMLQVRSLAIVESKQPQIIGRQRSGAVSLYRCVHRNRQQTSLARGQQLASPWVRVWGTRGRVSDGLVLRGPRLRWPLWGMSHEAKETACGGRRIGVYCHWNSEEATWTVGAEQDVIEILSGVSSSSQYHLPPLLECYFHSCCLQFLVSVYSFVVSAFAFSGICPPVFSIPGFSSSQVVPFCYSLWEYLVFSFIALIAGLKYLFTFYFLTPLL